MDSLKDRKRKEIEEYDGPMITNELRMFHKIRAAIIGVDRYPRQIAHSMKSSGGTKEATYYQHRGNVKYDYESISSESNYEVRETEELSSGSAMIRIESDGYYNSKIGYYVKLDNERQILLAEIDPHHKKVRIPIYGETEDLEEIGEVPEDEYGATVFETIGGRIREHKVLGEYADMIIGDFEQIMELDPEKQVTPVSEEQKKIASLHETVKRLESTNAELERQSAQKTERIQSILEKLDKALKFIEKVKNHPIAGLFFGKKVGEVVGEARDDELGDEK